MTLARTTFLEAVNRVLQMLGEAPVNSLDGQFGLAQQAQDSINDVSRKIQTEGWSFNTDYERLLMRDSSHSRDQHWVQRQSGQGRPLLVPRRRRRDERGQAV
jgi:hypothetical protein